MATMKVYVEVLPDELVPGAYLVHNDMTPTKPLGLNGFRAWLTTRADNLVECRCNFGGCKNYNVHTVHYRVDRGDQDCVRGKPMKEAQLRSAPCAPRWTGC
jgi:hypothetical protein